ncbi:MAG: terminase small subunit [Acidaminococcaceae bacterium]
MALNDKHKRFCEEYLVDLNATQAYIRAGYKVSERVAAVNAVRLMAKPEVQEYIARRQKELQRKTGITQEWVLEELYRVAAANASDFATIKKVGRFRTVDVLATEDIPEDKLSAIAGVKQGNFGIEVKLHDKLKALELLGKHLGLFDNPDKGNDGEVTIIDDL